MLNRRDHLYQTVTSAQVDPTGKTKGGLPCEKPMILELLSTEVLGASLLLNLWGQLGAKSMRRPQVHEWSRCHGFLVLSPAWRSFPNL